MIELSDILGEPALRGKPLSLGAAFPLLDMVAGRCAALFCNGSVVTGCFDDVSVENWLRHGDVVIAKAQVVAVGSSSMVVSIILYREVVRKRIRDKQVVIRCFTTFVAMQGENGPKKPRKNLPSIEGKVALELHHESIRNQDLLPSFKHWRRIMAASESKFLFESIDKDVLANAMRPRKFTEKVEVDETILSIRKDFLPRNMNFSGVVFGGDLLTNIEAVATTCAVRFSGETREYRTVAVRSLSFLRPVPRFKMLEISAKVIISSTHFVCVLVRAYIHSNEKDGGKVLSHHGLFHLIAVSDEDDESLAENNVELDYDGGHIDDFYRALCLPMSARLKKAWGVPDDPYPCSAHT